MDKIESPIVEKIPYQVYFGKVLNENRGTGELMDSPISLNDNYYWIRDDTKQSERILKRIKEENDYFDQKFKSKSKFSKSLYCEILSSMKENYDSIQTQLYPNSFYKYFSRYNTGSDYVKHYRINTQTQNLELLLDENLLVIEGKELDITDFYVNPSEKLMSYGIDYESNEIYELRIVNIETNELVHFIKDLVYCSYEWVNSNTIYYLKGNETNRLDKLYKCNLDTKEEILIYEETNKEFDLSIDITFDEKFLVIKSGNYSECKIMVIKLFDAEVNESDKLIMLFDVTPNVLYDIDHSGDYFYVYTNRDECTNWKIFRYNLEFGVEEEFIPHNPNIYIETFFCNKHNLVYSTKINGSTFVNWVDYSLNQIKIINGLEIQILNFSDYISKDYSNFKIDHVYTIRLSKNKLYNDPWIQISFDTMTSPHKIIKWNMNTLENILEWEKEVPNYNPNDYISERIWVPISNTCSDSNKWPLGIPVSIIYKKDLWNKDGTKPLYLYGYGSYGHTVEPSFDFKILPLLDRGWAYAIAHVRGGSFVNYSWYEDGRLQNKLNTFNDFITVAEYLKSNHYCEDITIEGRSAGGLLVGASMVIRPDLFKNVIAGVPFLDVMNTMCDSTIPLTVEEWTQWGNPNIKSDFDYMIQYCPYSNIKSTDYPNMFITCGLWDPRVQYWEPHKFIAKLREFKTDSNIQIIKTTINQGHFGGSSRYKYLKEVAEKYAFILDEDISDSE